MRIVQVITKKQLRGAEIFASQLSSEFIKEGHSVLIVALRHGTLFPIVDQVEYADMDTNPTQRFLSYKAWKKFSDLVKSWKPDIIQANASETLKFTVISKIFFGWKTPLVYRNANKVSDFIKSPWSLIFNRYLSRNVDFVISVSENCRVDFAETLDIPVSKTIAIPIGTVLPVKDEKTTTSPKTYWVNIASLVPEKNHRGLISIFKRYCDRGGRANLKIIGDGPLMKNSVELSLFLGIDSRIEFLGYRAEVGEFMANSVGLLLPSLIEGLPGVILEAMARKVPVVAYDVGGISEVIKHGETGMLLAKGDEHRFVDEMIRLEQNPGLKLDIINNANLLCKNLYGIESVAMRFVKQYNNILNS